MSRYYSEEQLINAISRLTRQRLTRYLEHDFITPAHSEHGPRYGMADLTRLELICDLSDQFDLQDDAMGVVLSLIDQLHGVRAELRALMQVIDAQPDPQRRQIIAALKSRLG
ncbi:MAG: hypothetical protein CSA68_09150 [Rhodobacterales bacterium]|nr:MAG: hypothetical protein CSA68_09150 [Rhodobacterales bacterium]